MKATMLITEWWSPAALTSRTVWVGATKFTSCKGSESSEEGNNYTQQRNYAIWLEFMSRFVELQNKNETNTHRKRH